MLAIAAMAPLSVFLALVRPWHVLVERAPVEPAANRLAMLLADPQAARRVGVEYLRLRPDEAAAPVLVDAIAAGLPGGRAAVATRSTRQLRALLAAATCADFKHDRTVVLEGWILSATEARLAALVTLA